MTDINQISMVDNPARTVWAILSAIRDGSPPATVIAAVEARHRIPEDDIAATIDALIEHGHVILDDEGTLRRVPESAIKSTAMAYGLSEDDVVAVFHMLSGAVAAGDTETIDYALRLVAAANDAAVPKRSRRRADA